MSSKDLKTRPLLPLAIPWAVQWRSGKRKPALLKNRFRVLRYDNRGHGATEVALPPYSFELFAEDAYALLQALGIAHTHFVGLSNGGMIAQTLALAHPEVIRSPRTVRHHQPPTASRHSPSGRNVP